MVYSMPGGDLSPFVVVVVDYVVEKMLWCIQCPGGFTPFVAVVVDYVVEKITWTVNQFK